MEELIEWVGIDTLKPHPKNRNQHSKEQIARLADIIKYQGWRHPIIVSTNSGYVAAGHGRLEAAKKLGLSKVPIHKQSFLDEDQEYAFLVSDNAIASWADLDLSGINSDLESLGPDFDISLLGIKDFVLEPADKFQGDEDAVPSIPKTAVTKSGDLYLLGNHRLLCGDATSREAVERLMNGEKADMVFTDPPYGIDYEYNEHDDSSPEENAKLVADAFSMYSCGKVWTPGKMNLQRDLSRFGKAKIAIWYKKFAMAGSGLGGASTFEPILIVNPKEKRLPNDVLVLSTDREEVNGKSLREQHSCPKPVELYFQLINAFCKSGDRVAEPFCGSGSTLIACEKTNRKCRGAEIDPFYVDIIVERWMKFSGKMAYLIGDANGELKNGPVPYAELVSLRSKIAIEENKNIVQ